MAMHAGGTLRRAPRAQGAGCGMRRGQDFKAREIWHSNFFCRRARNRNTAVHRLGGRNRAAPCENSHTFPLFVWANPSQHPNLHEDGLAGPAQLVTPLCDPSCLPGVHAGTLACWEKQLDLRAHTTWFWQWSALSNGAFHEHRAHCTSHGHHKTERVKAGVGCIPQSSALCATAHSAGQSNCD